MDVFAQRFAGRSVGIIGHGYLGGKLENLLSTVDLDLVTMGRDDLGDKLTRTYDYLFNCAGNTGDFRQKPVETVDSNVGLATRILESANVRESVVFLSSTRVYGFTDQPRKGFVETDDLRCGDHLDPDDIYDLSKKVMESLVVNTSRPYRKVALRLSNVYGGFGKGDLDDSTFLKLMIRHAADGTPLTTSQNAASSKDYIFIDDAIRGMLMAALSGGAGDVYNICSGRSLSLNDWANFLGLELTASDEAPATHAPVLGELAAEKIGFVPEYQLSDLKISDVFNG